MRGHRPRDTKKKTLDEANNQEMDPSDHDKRKTYNRSDNYTENRMKQKLHKPSKKTLGKNY